MEGGRAAVLGGGVKYQADVIEERPDEIQERRSAGGMKYGFSWEPEGGESECWWARGDSERWKDAE